jgi:hypothetical protein
LYLTLIVDKRDLLYLTCRLGAPNTALILQTTYAILKR